MGKFYPASQNKFARIVGLFAAEIENERPRVTNWRASAVEPIFYRCLTAECTDGWHGRGRKLQNPPFFKTFFLSTLHNLSGCSRRNFFCHDRATFALGAGITRPETVAKVYPQFHKFLQIETVNSALVLLRRCDSLKLRAPCLPVVSEGQLRVIFTAQQLLYCPA